MRGHEEETHKPGRRAGTRQTRSHRFSAIALLPASTLFGGLSSVRGLAQEKALYTTVQRATRIQGLGRNSSDGSERRRGHRPIREEGRGPFQCDLLGV